MIKKRFVTYLIVKWWLLLYYCFILFCILDDWFSTDARMILLISSHKFICLQKKPQWPTQFFMVFSVSDGFRFTGFPKKDISGVLGFNSFIDVSGMVFWFHFWFFFWMVLECHFWCQFLKVHGFLVFMGFSNLMDQIWFQMDFTIGMQYFLQ